MAALRVITSGVAPLADICCKILRALRHSPPLPQAVMTELYAAARGWRPLLCILSSVTMHSLHLPILAHPARVAWKTPSVLSTPCGMQEIYKEWEESEESGRARQWTARQ